MLAIVYAVGLGLVEALGAGGWGNVYLVSGYLSLSKYNICELYQQTFNTVMTQSIISKNCRSYWNALIYLSNAIG